MPISEDSTRGFLSYAVKDHNPITAIKKFRNDLQWSVGTALGSDFTIYLDRSDLPIGKDYDQPLHDAIEGSFFFFAMVSMRYFNTDNTRLELELALQVRARKGEGNYHIVPIYTLQGPEDIYYGPEMGDDDLVSAIKTISMVDGDDWRQFYRRLSSPSAKRQMLSLGTRLANQIRTRRWNTDGSETSEVLRSEHRHFVAKGGKGHRLIQAAIDVAAPGDSIHVGKGEYNEALILDKPLELIGAGLGETVVRAADKDVLRLQCAIGHITGFSFVQEGKTGFGVSIGQGRPELHHCEITSSAQACLSVHSGADPRVHDNNIHHGTQAGIFVHSEGLGTFEDNKIHNCEHANVEIADGSTPTFRRNNIYEGHTGGVYVRDGGRGWFEDNNIHHNSGRTSQLPGMHRHFLGRIGFVVLLTLASTSKIAAVVSLMAM